MEPYLIDSVWTEEPGIRLAIRRTSEGQVRFEIVEEGPTPGDWKVLAQATIGNYRLARLTRATVSDLVRTGFITKEGKR